MNQIKVWDVVTIKFEGEKGSLKSAEIDVPILAVSKRYNSSVYLIPNIAPLIKSEYELTEACLLKCFYYTLANNGLWGKGSDGEEVVIPCSVQLCED